MTGTPIDDLDLTEIGQLAVSELEAVPSDLHGSADFRRRVGAATVSAALQAAIEEARHG